MAPPLTAFTHAFSLPGKLPPAFPMITCQNATFPSEGQLSSAMDSAERALDMESVVLILNRSPACHNLDDLVLSPFTILIFSFLILKMG